MSKYTITIKDNEKGDVIFEQDFNAMVGALALDERGSTITLKGDEEETILAVNLVDDALNRLFEEDE